MLSKAQCIQGVENLLRQIRRKSQTNMSKADCRNVWLPLQQTNALKLDHSLATRLSSPAITDVIALQFSETTDQWGRRKILTEGRKCCFPIHSSFDCQKPGFPLCEQQIKLACVWRTKWTLSEAIQTLEFAARNRKNGQDNQWSNYPQSDRRFPSN